MSMLVPSNRLPTRRPTIQAGGGESPAHVPAAGAPASPAQPVATGALRNLAPLADFPSHLPLLEGFGIRDTAALRFWGAGGMRRMTVAIATGVPALSLQNLARRLDLMQVPGMKPDHARLLDACDVHHPTDLAHLAGPDPEAITERDRLLTHLQARARLLATRENRTLEVPTRDDLARLARAAVGLPDTTD